MRVLRVNVLFVVHDMLWSLPVSGLPFFVLHFLSHVQEITCTPACLLMCRYALVICGSLWIIVRKHFCILCSPGILPKSGRYRQKFSVLGHFVNSFKGSLLFLAQFVIARWKTETFGFLMSYFKVSCNL